MNPSMVYWKNCSTYTRYKSKFPDHDIDSKTARRIHIFIAIWEKQQHMHETKRKNDVVQLSRISGMFHTKGCLANTFLFLVSISKLSTATFSVNLISFYSEFHSQLSPHLHGERKHTIFSVRQSIYLSIVGRSQTVKAQKIINRTRMTSIMYILRIRIWPRP